MYCVIKSIDNSNSNNNIQYFFLSHICRGNNIWAIHRTFTFWIEGEV